MQCQLCRFSTIRSKLLLICDACVLFYESSYSAFFHFLSFAFPRPSCRTTTAEGMSTVTGRCRWRCINAPWLWSGRTSSSWPNASQRCSSPTACAGGYGGKRKNRCVLLLAFFLLVFFHFLLCCAWYYWWRAEDTAHCYLPVCNWCDCNCLPLSCGIRFRSSLRLWGLHWNSASCPGERRSEVVMIP